MRDQGKLNNILLNAVVDGFTGAALFGRLHWFGAPKEFIDSRTVDEYVSSKDYVVDLHAARHAKLRALRAEIEALHIESLRLDEYMGSRDHLEDPPRDRLAKRQEQRRLGALVGDLTAHIEHIEQTHLNSDMTEGRATSGPVTSDHLPNTPIITHSRGG